MSAGKLEREAHFTLPDKVGFQSFLSISSWNMASESFSFVLSTFESHFEKKLIHILNDTLCLLKLIAEVTYNL